MLIAEKNFSKHSIIKINEEEYIFEEKGTIFLRLYFLFRESKIIIFGDLHDWIFDLGRKPSINYFFGLTDKQYFWEKRSNKIKETYYPEKTKERCLEYAKEKEKEINEMEEYATEEEKKEVKELIEDIKKFDFSDEHYTLEKMFDYFLHYDFMIYSFDPQFNALWEGIKAFQKAHDKKYAKIPEIK